jgi:adhesin transport system outer membrane protein
LRVFRGALELNTSNDWGAGLSFLSRTEVARAQYAAFIANKETQYQSIELQLRSDIQNIQSLIKRSDVYQQIILANQETRASVKRQYLAGRKSWIDVLNAERELAASQTKYASLKADLFFIIWRVRLLAYGIDRFGLKK